MFLNPITNTCLHYFNCVSGGDSKSLVLFCVFRPCVPSGFCPLFLLQISKALHVRGTFGGWRYFIIKVHMTKGCGLSFVHPEHPCTSITWTPVYKWILRDGALGYICTRKVVGCLFITKAGRSEATIRPCLFRVCASIYLKYLLSTPDFVTSTGLTITRNKQLLMLLQKQVKPSPHIHIDSTLTILIIVRLLLIFIAS